MTRTAKSSSDSLSIWFFVGLLLLAYGIVLDITGIYEFFHPLQNTVVLSSLHATFWWGLLLTLLGVVYTFHFRPRKL